MKWIKLAKESKMTLQDLVNEVKTEALECWEDDEEMCKKTEEGATKVKDVPSFVKFVLDQAWDYESYDDFITENKASIDKKLYKELVLEGKERSREFDT